MAGRYSTTCSILNNVCIITIFICIIIIIRNHYINKIICLSLYTHRNTPRIWLITYSLFQVKVLLDHTVILLRQGTLHHLKLGVSSPRGIRGQCHLLQLGSTRVLLNLMAEINQFSLNIYLRSILASYQHLFDMVYVRNRVDLFKNNFVLHRSVSLLGYEWKCYFKIFTKLINEILTNKKNKIVTGSSTNNHKLSLYWLFVYGGTVQVLQMYRNFLYLLYSEHERYQSVVLGEPFNHCEIYMVPSIQNHLLLDWRNTLVFDEDLNILC